MLGAPTAIIVVDVVLSLTNAYEVLPRTDVVMHLFGGCAAALFAAGVLWHAGERSIVSVNGARALRLIVLGIVAHIAIGWEVFEYVTDYLLGTHW